jgi:hypothetical protein
MPRIRATQKLISFTDNKIDFDRIKQDMEDGWAIISLLQNGGYYIGVMEKMPDYSSMPNNDIKVFIPPRKKIKISY